MQVPWRKTEDVLGSFERYLEMYLRPDQNLKRLGGENQTIFFSKCNSEL